MTQHFTRRTALQIALGGGVAASRLSSPSAAAAQPAWPTRPINMVNPYAPGGYVDRMARAYAPYMEKALGRPIVIVSKPGANGMLGHSYFLQQPDDGHTILATAAAPFIVLNVLFQGARYKIEDFDLLNTPARDFTLLATSAKNEALKSIADVTAKLKADPASLSVGVQSASADYVNLMLYLQAAGIDRGQLRIVTYDGGGPTRNAVAGGVVDIGLVGGEGFLPIKQLIRPLLVFDDARRPAFDAPTFQEAFAPAATEFVPGSYRGFGVHATLKAKHPDRHAKILAAVKAVSDDPAAVEAIGKQDLETTWYGPEESNASFRRAYAVMEKYSSLLKQT